MRKKKEVATDTFIPLFAIRDSEGAIKPAIPKIHIGKDVYKSLPFIEDIVGNIENETIELISNEKTGEMTVVAYIVLEALTRAGATQLVESLLNNPTELYHATLYASIGWMAGQYAPEGIAIGTEISDSNINLRKLIKRSDGEAE